MSGPGSLGGGLPAQITDDGVAAFWCGEFTGRAGVPGGVPTAHDRRTFTEALAEPMRPGTEAARFLNKSHGCAWLMALVRVQAGEIAVGPYGVLR